MRKREPTPNGGWSIGLDNVKRSTYGRRCADCKMSFSSSIADDVETMWWEHVRDEHPNAWALLVAHEQVPAEML